MRNLFLGTCFLFSLAMLAGWTSRAVAGDDKVKANLAKLSEADRKIAEAQKICPVGDEVLGEVGVPIKLKVKDQIIFICCASCEDDVKKDPDGILKKVAELKKKNAKK